MSAPWLLRVKLVPRETPGHNFSPQPKNISCPNTGTHLGLPPYRGRVASGRQILADSYETGNRRPFVFL